MHHLLMNTKPILDRLAMLTLKGKFAKMVFIQCYFQTLDHDDTEIEKLYDQVQTLVDGTPKRDHLFDMGISIVK